MSKEFLFHNAFPFFAFGAVAIGIIVLWSVIWKGFALWHSARRGDKIWFIVLLVANTAGILEIIYLTFVAKIFAKKKADVVSDADASDLL